MKRKSRLISKAICIYIGKGTYSFPSHNFDDLVEAFGLKKAIQLEIKIRKLIRVFFEFKPNWSEQTLISASELAREIMQKKHPELTDEALDALEWDFSYQWK